MQQLRGFDELRNDQMIIQNRSAKIKKMAASLYLPSSHSSFRFLRLTQKKSSEQKIVFLALRIEVKNIRIRGFLVDQINYGHQEHEETIPV
jgi:hypothetical protein